MAEPTAPADVEEESTDSVDLEDMEVEFDNSEDDDSEAEESTEAEADEPDTEDEAKDDDDAEADKDEAPEETKESDEDKQKAFNKEQAEARIHQRQEREALLKQEQQNYVAEADTEDPRDLAVRQLQVDAYNNKVDGNTNKLTNGYEKAIKDFDILSDASPEIQTELNSALDAFQAMYVTVDMYGNPTEVRSDLYAFLQTKADSIKQLTGIGARKQQESKSKEKSKATTMPTRAPKTPKTDDYMAGFDEEANRW